MLDEGLCYINQTTCIVSEDAAVYNQRVIHAVTQLQQQLPTFALLGTGTYETQQGCLLVERGRFYGMGYLPQQYNVSDINELKLSLTQYPDNEYIRGLVYQYAEKNPHLKIQL